MAVKAFELFSKNENMKDRRMAEITYKTGLCYYAVMNHDKAIEEFEKAVNYIQKEIDTRSEVAQTAEAIKVVKEFCELRGEIQQKIADVQETKEMVKSSFFDIFCMKIIKKIFFFAFSISVANQFNLERWYWCIDWW